MDDKLDCQILSPSRSNVSSCPLLDFPNEVLYLILSFSLDFLGEEPAVENRKIDLGIDLLICKVPKFAIVLRSVCRHLRSLVNDMSFWYSIGFDPISLLPPTRQTVADQEFFLHLLLSDKHLADNIGRKRHWKFSTVQNIYAINQNVPCFRQNVISIDFNDFVQTPISDPNHSTSDNIKSSLNVAISLLSSFESLMNLRIGETTASCNLDTVSACCPALEHISLHDGGNLEGTLSLRYLQRFKITFKNPNATAEHVSNVFPHLSEKSLHNLTIIGNEATSPFITKRILDRYHSLKSIVLIPFTVHICDFLVHTGKRLDWLVTAIHIDFDLITPHLVEALKSPSLSELFFLSLSIFGPDDDSLVRITPIIVGITSNLRRLRVLEMRVGLDVHWCELFSNLTDLFSLHWIIPSSGSRDSEVFVSMLEDPADEDKNGRLSPIDEASNAFNNAFKNFENRPLIVVEISACPDSEDEEEEEEEE